jgi:hypothetical protein
LDFAVGLDFGFEAVVRAFGFRAGFFAARRLAVTFFLRAGAALLRPFTAFLRFDFFAIVCS